MAKVFPFKPSQKLHLKELSEYSAAQSWLYTGLSCEVQMQESRNEIC